MSYNTKNYTEQGGERTVIGGEIDIVNEGRLKFDGNSLSQVLYQSDSEATDAAGVVADFNKLLGKLRTAGLMFAEAPVITILTEPEDVTTIAGSITESLSVEAEVTGKATLTYQWYSNESDSNTDGTIVSGATSAEFNIPTDLSANTYYYYCVVSATEADSVSSEAVTVIVSAA